MALMMAGYRPERFKAVGAAVPICNLADWAEENPGYGVHVRACCSDSEEEMLERSPISHLDNIAKANLKIFHGKYDPVVPVTQSIKLYNRLFEQNPGCRVFLDIFDGGHEMDFEEAFYWLLTQYKGRDSVKATG